MKKWYLLVLLAPLTHDQPAFWYKPGPSWALPHYSAPRKCLTDMGTGQYDGDASVELCSSQVCYPEHLLRSRDAIFSMVSSSEPKKSKNDVWLLMLSRDLKSPRRQASGWITQITLLDIWRPTSLGAALLSLARAMDWIESKWTEHQNSLPASVVAAKWPAASSSCCHESLSWWTVPSNSEPEHTLCPSSGFCWVFYHNSGRNN